jgi:hypothetical protein
MMEAVEFLILFRRPEYPVFIVSSGKINPAFNLKELAKICVTIAPDGNNKSQIIDSKGSEFWYMPDKFILSPGFVTKKWTKKKLNETFNNCSNARESQQEYSMKSLSSKKLENIIVDLCESLNAKNWNH